MQAHYIGNWRVHQDSPEYGCDDNPSYEWFANEYVEGHWTGRTLRSQTLAELRAMIAGYHGVLG